MNTLLTISGIILLSILGIKLLGKIINFFSAMGKYKISDKWVVVTGCDSGFGLGIVEELVKKDVNVIAFTFTKEGSKNALDAGAKLAPKVDLTNETAVARHISRIKKLTNNSLWGLVHNAGMVQPGFIEYQQMETFRRVMDVNFFAPVFLTRQLITPLKNAGGRVILVSSVDGIVSLPGNAPYDASKFALEGYADALRVELSFWNIDVSVVNPATMKTPMAMTFFDGHRTAWEKMDEVDPRGDWKNAWTKEWLEEYIAFNKKNLAIMAQNPQNTVKDIMHALQAKRPKLRYLSGTLAKTLFKWLWRMPEEFSFKFKIKTVNPVPHIEKETEKN